MCFKVCQYKKLPILLRQWQPSVLLNKADWTSLWGPWFYYWKTIISFLEKQVIFHQNDIWGPTWNVWSTRAGLKRRDHTIGHSPQDSLPVEKTHPSALQCLYSSTLSQQIRNEIALWRLPIELWTFLFVKASHSFQSQEPWHISHSIFQTYRHLLCAK